jgi:hypothetical protein
LDSYQPIEELDSGMHSALEKVMAPKPHFRKMKIKKKAFSTLVSEFFYNPNSVVRNLKSKKSKNLLLLLYCTVLYDSGTFMFCTLI